MFASTAYAQTAAGAAAGNNGLADLLSGPLPVMIAMGALFYFLIMRPQQKRAKAHQEQISSLKRGDTVVLSSGMIGKITKVEDAEVTVEIAPKVEVKVVKSMISDVRTRGAPAVANDAKS